MKRALVTGASGFVGANLARRLVRDGQQVHILLRPQSDLWRLADLQDELTVHHVTLSDREAVADAVKKIRPDWIFHLAVHGAYSWQTNLLEMIDTNVTGTACLLEACSKAGFEAFVNTGSSSEYGFKDHPPHEGEMLEPNSHYAVTKASATLLCRQVAQDRKLHIPTLRLYSVYGPYEDPRRLIPTLVIKGLSGKLPVLVDPTGARDYIYIEDVVDAYLRAAGTPTDEPGAVYNVGTGIQTSIGQIVEVARAQLEIKEEPRWGSMPNRIWDTSNWVSDNRKLMKRLDWKPTFNLEDGFRGTVEWVRSNPAMQKFYEESMLAGAQS